MCNWCLQILYNTQPSSYTASCTPVTDVQVSQSVIPPGTNIPTNAQPPPQVTSNFISRRIPSSLATAFHACLLYNGCETFLVARYLLPVEFQQLKGPRMPSCMPRTSQRMQQLWQARWASKDPHRLACIHRRVILIFS